MGLLLGFLYQLWPLCHIGSFQICCYENVSLSLQKLGWKCVFLCCSSSLYVETFIVVHKGEWTVGGFLSCWFSELDQTEKRRSGIWSFCTPPPSSDQILPDNWLPLILIFSAKNYISSHLSWNYSLQLLHFNQCFQNLTWPEIASFILFQPIENHRQWKITLHKF